MNSIKLSDTFDSSDKMKIEESENLDRSCLMFCIRRECIFIDAAQAEVLRDYISNFLAQ